MPVSSSAVVQPLHAAQICVKLIGSYESQLKDIEVIEASIKSCMEHEIVASLSFHVCPETATDMYLDLMEIYPSSAVAVHLVLP